jgi:hypothetical protein
MNDAELKALWEQNREQKPGERIVDGGRNFMNQLFQLLGETADERFAYAVDALHEHRLVDLDGNWIKGAKGNLSREITALAIETINDLTEKGFGLNPACKAYVAVNGTASNSFDAAVKKIRLLVQDTNRANQAFEEVMRSMDSGPSRLTFGGGEKSSDEG